MIVAGLTGSIGMGKSTIGAMFRDLGAAVLDSDAVVHELYAAGGRAVQPVSELFAGVIVDGAIDRARLSAEVVGQPDAMRRLEAVVHPLVRDAQEQFIDRARSADKSLCILDIPLLFEIGAEARFDHIIVATTSAALQRQRVLARPGMNQAKFEKILSHQISDTQKRQKADHIIDTSGELAATRKQVAAVYSSLTGELNCDA